MKRIMMLLFLGLLLTACRSDEKPGRESQDAPWLQESQGPGPEITTIGFSREDTVLHYSVEVKYPAIREHEAFNAAVNANLKAAIDDFTGFIGNFDTEGRVMRSEYQLLRNTSRVVSVRQMYEWAVPGASTLQYRFYNVNYDPEARELIGLEKLFREGVDFRQALKKRLEEKIAARFKIEVQVGKEDLQSFTIGQDHLEFYKVLYPEVMDPEPKAFQVKFSEMENELR